MKNQFVLWLIFPPCTRASSQTHFDSLMNAWRGMKRIYLVLTVVLLPGGLYAQNNLDSIYNIWADESLDNVTRLEAIKIFLLGGEISDFQPNEFLLYNPDSALVLTDAMYELAIANGNTRYELLALRFKGLYVHGTGEYHEAVKLYEQCLEMAGQMDDNRLLMMSLICVGIGENAWGQTIQYTNLDSSKLIFERAEKHFQEALSMLKSTAMSTNEGQSSPDLQLVDFEANILSGLGKVDLENGNHADAIDHFKQAIKLHNRVGDEVMVEYVQGQIGILLARLKNYPEAIQYFTESSMLAEKTGNKHWMAHSLEGLGVLYAEVGELEKAEDYLTRALSSMQEAGASHKFEQLNILLGLHNLYIERKNYKKALDNAAIFLKLVKEISLPYISYAYIMRAEIYYEMGQFENALANGLLGLNEKDELNNDPYMTKYVSVVIGKIKSKQGRYSEAVAWCEKGIAASDLDLQQDACECLYESHKGLNNGNKALGYHEKFLALIDSLDSGELSKDLQRMEFSKQMLADSLAQVEADRIVEQAHQEEVLAKEKQRNIFLGSGIFVLLFAGGLWSRLSYVRKSKATLQVEKDRSEGLLLNILPAEIAEELKAKGAAQARNYEIVSIIFTDFKEFTQTSEKLTATELVSELNYCFKGFDEIMEKYGVEKIKTIGDAYMAASGLPVSSDDSTKNAVLAALEMQQFVKERKAARDATGDFAFEMRAGIHTGPVVAGIVGVKKFQYDIWGDTVNTASRMESNGEVGQVNISNDTYQLLKNDSAFKFNKRKKIEVKGKGEMEMYYITHVLKLS